MRAICIYIYTHAYINLHINIKSTHLRLPCRFFVPKIYIYIYLFFLSSTLSLSNKCNTSFVFSKYNAGRCRQTMQENSDDLHNNSSLCIKGLTSCYKKISRQILDRGIDAEHYRRNYIYIYISSIYQAK